MPFAEFKPSNAGDAFNERFLRNLEMGESLMDRAQRRRVLEKELEMKASSHAAELATSSLDLQQRQANLDVARLKYKAEEEGMAIGRLKRAEEESALNARAAARAGWKSREAELLQRFRDVGALSDPDEQSHQASILESDTAALWADPGVADILKKHFDSLAGSRARSAQSKLAERQGKNMVAPSLEDAETRFGARLIRPVYNPLVKGLVYIAEDHVDPRKDAEARQVLRMAAASGDLAKVEAVEKDPLVQSVLRVPGSTFADEYFSTVRSLRAAAPAPRGGAPVQPAASAGNGVMVQGKPFSYDDAKNFPVGRNPDGSTSLRPLEGVDLPYAGPPATHGERQKVTQAQLRDALAQRDAAEQQSRAQPVPLAPPGAVAPFIVAPAQEPARFPFVPVPRTEEDRAQAARAEAEARAEGEARASSEPDADAPASGPRRSAAELRPPFPSLKGRGRESFDPANRSKNASVEEPVGDPNNIPNPELRPIVGMAGKLLKEVNGLPDGDLKKLFLQVQHDILLGIVRHEWSPEAKPWLNKVVKRFMDPVFEALDGRPNEGWKKTLRGLNRVQYYRDYVGLYPDWMNQYHTRALDIYSAREMAMTHINQDLKRALTEAGKGTDEDWRTLGNIVKHSESRFFSLEETLASKLGGALVDESLNVGKSRDSMRRKVPELPAKP